MTPESERDHWDAAAREPDGGRLAIWGEPGRWEERIAECYDACVKPVMDGTQAVKRLGVQRQIADIGCGIGRLTFPAAYANPDARIIAIDVAPAMLEHLQHEATARRLVNVAPMLCDGRALPDSIDGLHGAYSMITFQHIPWDGVWGYLRGVARLIFPGGVFRFQFVEGDQAEPMGHHFPMAKVTAALESFGLAVASVDRGLMYPEWSWVTARKPGRF